MPATHTYPAEIERDKDGRYVVTFPDFGWDATDGATQDEALAEARNLLRELIVCDSVEAMKQDFHTYSVHHTTIPNRLTKTAP